MRHIRLNETESTNDYIKNLETLANFDIVSAEIQTKGRGRRGKKWLSGSGGAWFSFALAEDRHVSIEEYKKLPLITGISVLKALEEITGRTIFKYKWINDIYINNLKCAGILIEKTDRFFIIGIGINVNISEFYEFENIATSIKRELGQEYEVTKVIEAAVEKFMYYYSLFLRGEWSLILNEIRENNFLLEKEIVVKTDYSEVAGVCKGISNEGELIVKAGEEIITADNGEITIIKNEVRK